MKANPQNLLRKAVTQNGRFANGDGDDDDDED
jgi:hypothetical protein